MNNEIYGPADRNTLAMIITQLTEARPHLPIQLHRIVDTLIDVARVGDCLSEADVRQATALIARAHARTEYNSDKQETK